MRGEKRTIISLRIEPALLAEINRRAAEERLPRSEWIRRALSDIVDLPSGGISPSTRAASGALTQTVSGPRRGVCPEHPDEKPVEARSGVWCGAPGCVRRLG